MTFDPQLTLAKMHAIRFEVEHYIRTAKSAGDKDTLATINAVLSSTGKFALVSIKHLKRPQNWQLVCDNCGYKGERNKYGKTLCFCGERLRVEDLG